MKDSKPCSLRYFSSDMTVSWLPSLTANVSSSLPFSFCPLPLGLLPRAAASDISFPIQPLPFPASELSAH